MNALCQHTLIEYHGCDAARLCLAESLRVALLDAVRAAGGTIVTDVFHTFSPYGVTGVVVIAESHVTIHTWPEYGYAAVDVFSCSKKLNHAAIKTALHAVLGARRATSRTLERGLRRLPVPRRRVEDSAA